jgi:hypothetical protein
MKRNLTERIDFSNPNPKYYGKYVITPFFQSNIVISYSKDFGEAYEKAINLGFEEPIVNYIFDPEKSFIFKNNKTKPVINIEEELISLPFIFKN